MLVKEIDYAVGFPTKQIRKYLSTKRKIDHLISDFKPDMVLVDRQSSFGLEIIKRKIPLFVLLRAHFWSEVEVAKETIYKGGLMRKVVDMRSDVGEKVFAECTLKKT